MLEKILSDCLAIIPFCLLTALLSSIAGRQICNLLRAETGWRKAAIFSLAAGLFLVPPIAIGAAWAPLSYHLIRLPLLKTFLYSLVLSMKLAPAAAMVFHLVPETVSRQSLHCARLASSASPATLRMRFHLAKSAYKAFCASILVTFLLSFSEFELASFLTVRHWTVTLFDLNAGGLPLAESLKLCTAPVLVELFLILVFVFFYRGEKWLRSGDAEDRFSRPQDPGRAFPWFFALSGAAILFGFPVFGLLRGGMSGLGSLFDGTWFVGEALSSVCVGLASALAAFHISGFFLRRRHPGSPPALENALLLAIILPGLTGALPLALAFLFIIQTPGFIILPDTPIPLVIALTIFQMPYAFLLRFALSSMVPDESLFIARSMLCSDQTRNFAVRIIWILKYAARLAVFSILFIAAYFDITMSFVLAPPAMPTIFPRLYNLLHYGQNTRLSATILAAMLIPALVIAASAAISRISVPLFNSPRIGGE